MVKAADKSPSDKPEGKPSDKNERSIESMTWREKCNFLRDNITVEPMLACYIIPSVFASLATQNLNLEKACRVNLGYSTEVCDALSARNTGKYHYFFYLLI